MVEATFKRLLEEQLRFQAEAQRRIDAYQAQLVEVQSASDSLCILIESTITLAKSQDQAIVKTWKTIVNACLQRTLKAREETIKTLTNLSRQNDDLTKTFLAKQAKLEALKSDPMNNLTIREEELWRHTTFQAYKAI